MHTSALMRGIQGDLTPSKATPATHHRGWRSLLLLLHLRCCSRRRRLGWGSGGWRQCRRKWRRLEGRRRTQRDGGRSGGCCRPGCVLGSGLHGSARLLLDLDLHLHKVQVGAVCACG